MKNIAILGSTGSIGKQTIEVIKEHTEELRVCALAADSDVDGLIRQALIFRPYWVIVTSEQAAERVRNEVGRWVRVEVGQGGFRSLCSDPNLDLVVNALPGSVGWKATRWALERSVPVALANKESLVMAGDLMMRLSRQKARIVPIDSEHASLAQLVMGLTRDKMAHITLTASGGALRHVTDRAALAHVRVDDVLKHPTWNMGRKVTLDSATMANKGMEIIEAHHLFRLKYEDIHVVLHPQSIVHALVTLVDRTVVAHMAAPDMRIPIQFALTYPHCIPSRNQALSIAELGSLTFSPLCTERYPMVAYARNAGMARGTMPTVYSVANEVAGQLFFEGAIPFDRIESLVYDALEVHDSVEDPTWEDIDEVESWTRQHVRARVKTY
ncbi:MAG: 1-deoxy-D-xylulose-5-phosphate reductoisomerase [Paenibacillaceae bacterium]|nr:1-deoxy-D-xylulose-5-phosphate reductoisomerase [Paenibacillaceae bacterium]